MKGFIAFPVLICLVFGTPVLAGYQKGLDAAESGDYATALREWKPIAEQGYANAQNSLGVLYEKGYGVVQNYKTATNWYLQAAEQGNVYSQHNLGVMYAEGQDVTQNYARAYMWWSIAAGNGHKESEVDLVAVEKEMTPTQVNKAKKLALECIGKNYSDC